MNKRPLIIVIIFTICFGMFPYAFCRNVLRLDQFSISAKAYKEKYYPYEAIDVEVCFKNEDKIIISPVPLSFSYKGFLRYLLLDENQKRLEIVPLREDYGDGASSSSGVKPGEKICKTIDLTFYYNIGTKYGKYYFKYIYDYIYDPQVNYYVPYKFAEAHFEIIPPEDEKEREALKELDPLMQKYYITNTYPVDTREDVILGFERFIEKYPESIYAELASISRIGFIFEYFMHIDELRVYFYEEYYSMLYNELKAHEEKYSEIRYREPFNMFKNLFGPALERARADKSLKRIIHPVHKDHSVGIQNLIYKTFKESLLPPEFKEFIKPEALKLQEAAEAKRARNKKITIALIFLGILILIGGALYLEYSSGKAANKNNK